ncbi:type II toxin-antitoxin system VapC family toxin [Ornithinimicrobium ciconiae]|uniref:type II toxin-antitoxin system VapC family toxin n=1 Tax=Ornithinimicrobium ciconiae TaxID=2594265 RepID=UPI0013FD0979|nr:type II toxin-antitoxin system VapC family toxin [Ornithinimicrobium ciconiae]
MRLVLDASAAVNAVLPGPLRELALGRLEGAELLAPDLIDTEVLSALARLSRADVITADEADRALASWQRLPCTRVSVEPLLDDIWDLRQSLRVTDAHYVVLCRVFQATLLTADQRLVRAAPPGVSILTIS